MNWVFDINLRASDIIAIFALLVAGLAALYARWSSIEAKKLLETTRYDVKCAILIEKTGLDFESCRDLLLKYQNNVAKVIRQYKK